MSVKILRSAGRPTKIEEFLLLWGQDVAIWFEEWQIMNNRVSSGDSSKGYIVDLSSQGEVIVSNEVDYLPYPLTGRNAGKFPPVDDIKQWIIDKGISLQEISLNSLAFLIGRKIAREGTNQPRLKEQNLNMVVQSKSAKWISRISEQQAKDINFAMLEVLTKSGTWHSY